MLLVALESSREANRRGEHDSAAVNVSAALCCTRVTEGQNVGAVASSLNSVVSSSFFQTILRSCHRQFLLSRNRRANFLKRCRLCFGLPNLWIVERLWDMRLPNPRQNCRHEVQQFVVVFWSIHVSSRSQWARQYERVGVLSLGRQAVLGRVGPSWL